MSVVPRISHANADTPIWAAVGTNGSVETLTDYNYQLFSPPQDLAEDPQWTVLNTLNFVAPANGNVVVECLGTFVGVTTGATAVLTFFINGASLTIPSKTQAYAGNINFINVAMDQFPVVAGQTYLIEARAQCSALPPAGADVVATSSRVLLLFSEQ